MRTPIPHPWFESPALQKAPRTLGLMNIDIRRINRFLEEPQGYFQNEFTVQHTEKKEHADL